MARMFPFNGNSATVTAFVFISVLVAKCSVNCSVPVVLRGTWFSIENGQNTLTELDANSMSKNGDCLEIKKEHEVNYKIVFKQNGCYTCVNFFIRTVNVLEKQETPCLDIPDDKISLEYVCNKLDSNQELITLFSDNYVPASCASSFKGVWNFAYENPFRFTGECNHPDSYIRSCPKASSQYLSTNQKFNITYKACPGIIGLYDGIVEYSCLGDWFVGKNQYFAVVNTRESRKHEKYRCFVRNEDDDLNVGVSITAECNNLKTVKESPERLHLVPVKSEIIQPGCEFPQNFSGNWINTANIDSEVSINETHIVETLYLDEGKLVETIYVCKERRGTKIIMAKPAVAGCQKEYLCFDFVPRHHNIIRYHKGKPVITDDFETVCSSEKVSNGTESKYDFFLKKDPEPITCPIAGKFNFTQKGDVPFETRIWGGITLSPRPNTYCKQNISDFSVCDTDQKEIAIDENYCLLVDYRGRPIDFYNEPDYRTKCIAYWKENMKSYLITYDESDSISSYKCWVYQITDSNKVQMSHAIGSFCDIKQDAFSSNYTEGATVHLELQEYKPKYLDCPMHFDDGSNPWGPAKSTSSYLEENTTSSKRASVHFNLFNTIFRSDS